MNALPDRIGLPHEPDCEASVLGGILIRPESLHDLTWLEVEHFWDMRNRVVFTAMRNLVADGRPIDVVLLEAELERTGKSEAVGGIAYLGELSLRVPTADNVVEYAALIKKAWRERKVLEELHEALARVKRGTYDADDVLDETVGELQRLQEASVKPAASVVEVRLLSELADEIVKQSSLPEMDWGIDGLNRLAPMPIRSLSTMVGPTGAGKTSLAMRIAAHRTRYLDKPAKRQGPSVYMLFELTPTQFAARRTSQMSRFNWRQVLGGVMTAAEIRDTLTGEHFYVVKPPRRVNVVDYANRVLDEVAKRSPGDPLLVIDYLQRIKGDGKDLRIDYSNIVDGLVDLVESRDMYGLLLSKGSRTGSKSMRDGKSRGEALVDTSAETSAIEFGSANIIAITYENREGADITDARVEIPKGRFGSTGACVPMRFHGASGLWEELTEVQPMRSERDADDRIMSALDRAPGGYESRTELHKAAGGNKSDNLSAIRRLMAFGGPIEIRNGRLVKRDS